jgi:hypothetical protein
VRDVSLAGIMMFHFDAAIQMMEDILNHDLVNTDELYEILEYKEKESESTNEERLWKVLKSFLYSGSPGKVLKFSPELRGPDVEKD